MNSVGNETSRCLAVELFEGGHRCSYVEALAIGGYDGAFLLSAPVFERLREDVKNMIRARTIIAEGLLMTHQQRTAIVRKSVLALGGGYQIFFLYFDDYIIPLIKLRLLDPASARWASRIGGLLFHNRSFRLRQRSFRERWRCYGQTAMLRLLATSTARCEIRTQDVEWGYWLKAKLPTTIGIGSCPEPILLRHEDMQYSDAIAGKVRVGFFGAHSPRKGTLWAAQILARTPECFEIYISGDMKDDPQLRAWVAKSSGVNAEAARLTHAEIVDRIKRVDVVALPYEGFYGSSAIMAHAIALGKPIAATDGGVIGQVVSREHVGFVFQPGDAEGFKQAVFRAASLKGYCGADFISRNSPKAFAKSVIISS